MAPSLSFEAAIYRSAGSGSSGGRNSIACSSRLETHRVSSTRRRALCCALDITRDNVATAAATATAFPRIGHVEQQRLGILPFLENKRILITGATGFLGKVLVEKILRAQPKVSKIYLLVHADSHEKARQRLEKDILESRLFELIREEYGADYRQFMLEKLVAIPGSVEKNDLGLEKHTKEQLLSQLDVVVNSAATTKFFERYDVALAVNTKGPLNLLEFAKKCSRLQLFLHVSTAYSNGLRQGRILEKPLASMSNGIAPPLDVWKEIDSVRNIKATSEELKELGMQRAQLHGWQDTYVFTKAMGETLVTQSRGDVPVVILRPSVVEGTSAQPFGGWIQGTRMMDPMLLAYGLGHLTGFYADPDCVLDVIPADMVVNSLLAAMSVHAGRPGLSVYHVGSSTVNPLTFRELAACTEEYFQSNPVLDERGNPVERRMTFYDNKLAFSVHKFLCYSLPIHVRPPNFLALNSCYSFQVARLSGSRKLQNSAKRTAILAERLDQLVETYSAYTFYKGRFDITNTKTLYEQMLPEEKEGFGFDIGSIRWNEYITNVHLPGLRKNNRSTFNTKFRLITMKESIQGLFAV
ncbi:hypothetical protein SELMODRAFT_270198 [Selaginella moellendorffii]|uniref:Fatty acyl-CoA reductase n=1 Tax=Selaginella moellendorffii TaxID=88036 RepID=D8QQX1_SELML|nr:fatty acyl-CoA reductase 2 isoform X1 [Selaginella moellendorffii]EFJ37876.1 hypothetical protein SELMODRAFT_270198 [Selaginella moellendorffii]|eukprot:XP_002960337.1 fatty acyl-CoA reductase 2 isoform X1 [Selaginella moellendorffii]